jgi:pimeloyl-ACP methyl ester carboxylesterase
MQHLRTPTGVTLSFDRYGSGPPLVLVHGGFSDHQTNWEFVKASFEKRFTTLPVARRGRGETDATRGHLLEDEARDVAALIQSLGEPVFLLGHSYGGQVSLAATARVPEHVRKLVLYEPPWPSALRPDLLGHFDELAAAGEWDAFAVTFFRDGLSVPLPELDAIRASELWAPIVGDAAATLGDLHALARYEFSPERFRELRMPVLLQIGSESPRDLFVTDALAPVLPDVRIEELPGQAHEAMTTAPDLYADSVIRFLDE